MEMCTQSIALLKSERNHIVEAMTGAGKTVVLSYVAAQMGQPTLIVVNKQDLVDQWKDALEKVLKIDPTLIGHIQQDTCVWEGKKFVIGMAHSLVIPDRYPEAMYKYFGMLIVDECHQFPTESFVKVCYLFPAKYRAGCSATPTRKDGKDKLLTWNIGPVLVRGEVKSLAPKILVKQTGWKIPCTRKLVGNSWEYVPIPHAPGRMMTVTKAQASSVHRNTEIVNFVKQAYDAERRILIVSDLKDYHLDRLFQMLCQKGIPGEDIGYYVGGMSKIELELSKVRRVVLATIKMCGTGTDCPAWDSMVLATPRADVKQLIGRVMREKENKKCPVVLDLVDSDAIFQSFHQSRRKQYLSVGAEIVKV
jgi:superfamily II DNA or RNA helicase